MLFKDISVCKHFSIDVSNANDQHTSARGGEKNTRLYSMEH